MRTEQVIDKRLYPEILPVTTVGIDIGSRMGKIVLLDKEQLVCYSVATGVNMQETADYLIKRVLELAGKKEEDISYIVGTGYGRISMDFNIPHGSVTEISCHAMGAHFLNKDTRTIIDIGGQDSKAIKVETESGKVAEFVMNDKCAAGTGRFFEKVADLLNLKLEEAGKLALESQKKLDISSQCVVFAESEIVSLRAKGEAREDIIAAVNVASARRVKNLVNRIGLEPELVFSGGVSNNPGMKSALEEVVGQKFLDIDFNMSFNGALGAAIYAQHYYEGGQGR